MENRIKIGDVWYVREEQPIEEIEQALITLNKLKEAINYTRCSTQLLCVSEVKGIGLTKGLKYKTNDTDSFYFTITNDYGEICEYHKSKFEVISE